MDDYVKNRSKVSDADEEDPMETEKRPPKQPMIENKQELTSKLIIAVSDSENGSDGEYYVIILCNTFTTKIS